MANTQYCRLITKSSSGVPTVPASASHDAGDWTMNDIYESELYIDSTSSKLYTRKAGNIKQLTGATPADKLFVWTLDFLEAIEFKTFTGLESFKINSITNINGTPTIVTKVGGVVYIPGATIAKTSELKISVSVASVINLNCEFI